MKSFGICVTILILFSTYSHAYTPKEGNISAYAGAFAHQTIPANTKDFFKSPLQGGLGFVVLGDINDRASLEIGSYFMNKIYFRREAGNHLAEMTKLVHITMGYHRWFNDVFSGSITFFSAYSMGDPQIIHNDFILPATSDTSARDITEYGFDFSILTEVASFGKYSLVLDSRYSKSVTAKTNEDSDHYMFLLGLKYLFHQKK